MGKAKKCGPTEPCRKSARLVNLQRAMPPAVEKKKRKAPPKAKKAKPAENGTPKEEKAEATEAK